MKVIERLDPEILKCVKDTREFTYADGALPRKFKFLIGMALDAAQGAEQGVKALAREAMQAGATKQELAEALRVAYYICGAVSIFTAARGLKELF